MQEPARSLLEAALDAGSATKLQEPAAQGACSHLSPAAQTPARHVPLPRGT